MTEGSADNSAAYRVPALIAMAVALIVGVGAWYGLDAAAQRGIERLAAIERARAVCAVSWNAAHARAETLLVDAIALRDTIDPRSDQALSRCGDLRTKAANALPNPREMNGEPMPRGLR